MLYVASQHTGWQCMFAEAVLLCQTDKCAIAMGLFVVSTGYCIPVGGGYKNNVQSTYGAASSNGGYAGAQGYSSTTNGNYGGPAGF